MMSKDELSNPEYFPQFILVRRPVDIGTLDQKQTEQMHLMFKSVELSYGKALKTQEEVLKIKEQALKT